MKRIYAAILENPQQATSHSPRNQEFSTRISPGRLGLRKPRTMEFQTGLGFRVDPEQRCTPGIPHQNEYWHFGSILFVNHCSTLLLEKLVDHQCSKYHPMNLRPKTYAAKPNASPNLKPKSVSPMNTPPETLNPEPSTLQTLNPNP